MFFVKSVSVADACVVKSSGENSQVIICPSIVSGWSTASTYCNPVGNVSVTTIFLCGFKNNCPRSFLGISISTSHLTWSPLPTTLLFSYLKEPSSVSTLDFATLTTPYALTSISSSSANSKETIYTCSAAFLSLLSVTFISPAKVPLTSIGVQSVI